MDTVKTLSLLCIALPFIGAAIDRIMLLRHKTKLHESLIGLWVFIEQIKFSDIPHKVINYIDKLCAKINFRSWRFWAYSILLSWLTTSVASVFGYFSEPQEPIPIIYAYTYLPHALVYATNYVFDLFTLLATMYFIKKAVKTRCPLTLSIGVLDIILASLLALLAYSANEWGKDYAANQRWVGMVEHHRNRLADLVDDIQPPPDPESFLGLAQSAIYDDHFKIDMTVDEGAMYYLEYGAKSWVNGFRGTDSKMPIRHYTLTLSCEDHNYRQSMKLSSSTTTRKAFPEFYIANTTFLPTVVVWLLIFSSYIVWISATISRPIMQLYLERSTEDNPAIDPAKFIPFTLLGIVLAASFFVVRLLYMVF